MEIEVLPQQGDDPLQQREFSVHMFLTLVELDQAEV